MSNPLTFDLIVGLALSLAIIFGVLFGFFKMLLVFLAFYSSFIVGLLLMAAGIDVSHLAHQNLLLAGGAIIGLPLVLIILVLSLVPGAKSAAGRVFGVVFAAAWATVAVSAATMAVSLSHPEMQQVLREKTLTGPTIFAVGNVLVSLLPDNAGISKKQARQTT